MNDEAGPWLGEPATNGRTAFWTWSHRAISRAAKIKGIDLWQLAKKFRSSPIAYSDASPCGQLMKNGKVGKGPFIPPTDLEEHAWSLLRLPETQIGRCPLVIVSGRKDTWQRFYDVAQREFERREAIWVEVPFFGPAPKFGKGELVAEFDMRLRNDQRVQPIIRRVVEAWARDKGVL